MMEGRVERETGHKSEAVHLLAHLCSCPHPRSPIKRVSFERGRGSSLEMGWSSPVIREGLGVELLLLHIHVSYWEEALWQTQDSLERWHLSSDWISWERWAG